MPVKDGLPWPPLLSGVLIKRYKRFLADVTLADGRRVTAHCPNSGRMTGCSLPGQPVYLSHHHDPKRKLHYTWEMIRMPSSLVGVNTMIPNRLIAHCLRGQSVPALAAFSEVRSEVKVSPHTRLDLMLSNPSGEVCYVEVKNCTLVEDGVAMFPDAPTVRGRKHLQELVRLRRSGARAVIFFLIQRCDAAGFTPAAAIDPDYARGLKAAVRWGVEIIAYDVRLDLNGIALGRPVPCRF